MSFGSTSSCSCLHKQIDIQSHKCILFCQLSHYMQVIKYRQHQTSLFTFPTYTHAYHIHLTYFMYKQTYISIHFLRIIHTPIHTQSTSLLSSVSMFTKIVISIYSALLSTSKIRINVVEEMLNYTIKRKLFALNN